MPLRVYLKGQVDLDDFWLDKEAWFKDMKQDKTFLVDFLNEDLTTFLEEAGGLLRLVTKAVWVDG